LNIAPCDGEWAPINTCTKKTERAWCFLVWVHRKCCSLFPEVIRRHLRMAVQKTHSDFSKLLMHHKNNSRNGSYWKKNT